MNRNFVMGVAVGVGALMVLPGVAAGLGRAARPLVRAAGKTGAVAFEEFRKAGAEAYEQMEDIVAEIREEMEAERKAEAYDDEDAPAAPDAPAEG